MSRMVQMTPMKQRASGGIRRLAGQVAQTFPDMTVHQHLTDAAREVDSGRTEGAKRHLNAAIASFAPLNIRRHGVQDDQGHLAAKNFMQQAYRHLLLVKDIEDVSGRNQQATADRKDAAMSALQQRAMRNAQPQPVGKSDGAAEGPASPAPTDSSNGTKNIAASWDGVLDAIELTGKTPPHETASGRKALKAKGQTAYGTSYPVPNVNYLKKAIHSIGRAPAEKRGQLKSFLKKRAAALGASALTANLTAAELAAIDLAVSGGQVIELVFHPDQARGHDGKWISTAHGSTTHGHRVAFNFSGEPGSLSHVAAIMAAAEGIRDVSDTAANAVHNAGRMTAMRQMGHARNHLAVAERETRNTGAHDIVRSISDSLTNVPKGVGREPYARHQAPRDLSPRQPGRLHGPGYYPSPTAVVGAAWEDVLNAVELSANTGRLAVEPHPFGKPGGPGLWDVKSMELPPYIQNIARALLRTGRAKDLSQAIAIAKGATNRWSHGGGHVSPEVRAASTATNASWNAKRAVAHAHTASAGNAIELDWTAWDQGQAAAGHRKGATDPQKHRSHLAHLRHLLATGKITAAQKKQLATAIAQLKS